MAKKNTIYNDGAFSSIEDFREYEVMRQLQGGPQFSAYEEVSIYLAALCHHNMRFYIANRVVRGDRAVVAVKSFNDTEESFHYHGRTCGVLEWNATTNYCRVFQVDYNHPFVHLPIKKP